MKKVIIQHFFLGIVIAFTLAVLILSAVFEFATEEKVLPIALIGQVLVLSLLCSLINLIYQSDRLTFLWQSLLGYILTTSAIITCGLVFGWYSYSGSGLDKEKFVLLSFFGYSFFYLITWLIIWTITKKKKKRLNEKLSEYKLRQ